jgi:hypothetical protein
MCVCVCIWVFESNLQQGGESGLVCGWGASGSGIFPVNVQAVKLVLSQELDNAADERLAVGCTGHHCCEPGYTHTQLRHRVCV